MKRENEQCKKEEAKNNIISYVNTVNLTTILKDSYRV